jgi:hypothetical protein
MFELHTITDKETYVFNFNSLFELCENLTVDKQLIFFVLNASTLRLNKVKENLTNSNKEDKVEDYVIKIESNNIDKKHYICESNNFGIVQHNENSSGNLVGVEWYIQEENLELSFTISKK